MPTSAKSRCGWPLRAMVPCVTLKALPAATPHSACSAASTPKSAVVDAMPKPSAAAPKPSVATSRSFRRLKRGASTRLAHTAPTRKSVASRPACRASKRYCAINALTHTGSATRSTMPAQCATIKAARPRLELVRIMSRLRSDRLRQRHQRLAHDAGVLFLVAAGDLDLAQASRVLDDHAAALPAAVLEGVQRAAHVARAAQLFGQHQGILDADAGTGRQVWRRCMHGVSD